MDRTFLDLEISRHPDGAWNLKQAIGPCDPTDEHWVIIEPEQMDVLAKMAGYVPKSEIDRACELERERLKLLAAMVKAHTRDGDPLRAAAAVLIDREDEPAPLNTRTAPASVQQEGQLDLLNQPGA